MSRPAHLHITGADPRQRGEDRGRQAAVEIARAWRIYLELFEAVAVASQTRIDVAALAQRSISATRAWAPELVTEMEGVAEGAGLPLWAVAALNARTELLAVAGAPRAGECSTVVHVGQPTIGGQSWDWHAELADAWHVQSVCGDALGFTGITEYGILAKIGINEAGVGVLLNILGHVDDGVDGVPVHLVARKVLGSAASFDDAVAILSDAPVSASTVMTVVTADRAASVEVSPAGTAVLAPDEEGWLLHTNHFLDPALADGELRGRREPETYDRLRALAARLKNMNGLHSVDDLAALLAVHPDGGAEVCCHPPAVGQLGTRWATLATVVVEPASRRLMLHPGGPCSARASTWMPVTAPHCER